MFKKLKKLLVYDKVYYNYRISNLIMIILCILAIICFIIASQL